MEQVNSTLNVLQSIAPAEVWLGLIGGPTASLIVQKFKKWLSIEPEWVIIVLVATVSMLEVIGAYLVAHVTKNPAILGDWWPIVAFSSVAFYHMIGKPIIGVIEDAKELNGDLSGSRISAVTAEAAAKAQAAGLLPSAERITPAVPADHSDAAEFTAVQ